jgi:hypothetical protein
MVIRMGSLLAAGLLASACATTRAAAPVERPALEVPPVPPRVVEVTPMPDFGSFEPVPDLPPERPVSAATTKPKPSTPRESANRDTQKPEAKPAEPLPPVADPAPQASPPQVTPVIRTPSMPADPAASERQIRDTINSAQKSLDSVDFKGLPEQRKKAYNEAKDFIARAEVALKASSFELAKELAGKAEKLANELQGR